MLSGLLWIPIVGATLLGFWPGSLTFQQTRRLGLVFATGLTVWTVFLFGQFDLTQGGLQMREFMPWIPMLGMNYELGVDGLSLPLLAVNSGLTWIAIYGTGEKLIRPRLFYSLLLLVNGAVAGAFLAQNALLFFLFYEIELVPFYLLISIWGGPRRGYAAIKFLLYTAVSGILMLAGFLGLFWLADLPSFDYQTLQSQVLPLGSQMVLLLTLLVAFGIKIPLVPFHTWLPDAYTEASAPVAMILGGVLAKLGTYGLVRFCLGFFPDAWSALAPNLSIWAVVCVLGGAFAAIAQKDIKRMVAYSSVGHMGYVLLGCAAATPLSIVGAIAQMVSHGFVLALLFHLVGVIEEKVGTRELDVLNGLLNPIRGLPMISGLLILGGMASAGIPGLVAFVAEFLVFQGSYSIFPLQTILCVVGTGLTAVYFVILLNRTCFGKLDNKTAYYPQVMGWEQTPAILLTLVIFILGVQPNWLVKWSEPFSYQLSTHTPQLVSHWIPPVMGKKLENTPIMIAEDPLL
ncbi:MAG: NADH-quinone oxidoreductase subunit M [Cyanobacteriota bacterium]|nr:NADH-quinone oxidoreductase subunit M [Cyanobacteriota bacterium]